MHAVAAVDIVCMFHSVYERFNSECVCVYVCVFLLRRGALATHHFPTGLGSSASASTVEKVLLSLYDDGMSKTHTPYIHIHVMRLIALMCAVASSVCGRLMMGGMRVELNRFFCILI